MKDLKEKISQLAKASSVLGKVGILVMENDEDRKTALSQAEKILAGLRYRPCVDAMAMMDDLAGGKKKLLYVERGARLDGLVLEIVAEFEAGLISLADRKGKTGLKTAAFNPADVSLIILLSRGQLGKSHPRFFEYVQLTQSL